MDGYQTSDGDVGGAPRGDRTARLHAKLALNGIQFSPIAFDDPVPLGRQILAQANLRPADGYQLYAILDSGDFEDVRLDEQFDLRSKGVERFVAFTGDRVYRIVVDGREVKWGPDQISEPILRYLGGIAAHDAVFLEVRGGTDRLIATDELVDLTRPGVESFISALPTPRYILFINGVRHETDQRSLTGAQIKALATDWDPTHDLVLEGHGDEPDRVIGDEEVLDLKSEHGPHRFSSVPKANFG